MENLLLTEFRRIVDEKVDDDVAGRGFEENAHDCIDIKASIYGFVVSRRRSPQMRVHVAGAMMSKISCTFGH